MSAPAANVAGIHRGAITHHQDQSMMRHSFKTIKASNRSDVKPMPPDVDDSFDILLFVNGL